MIRLSNRAIITTTTLVSIVLWFVGAFLPAYITESESSDVYGLMCFVYGPLALVFITSIGVGWFGNAFGVVAIWYLWKRKYKNALRYGIVAFVIGCLALFVTEIPANENGNMEGVTLGPGIFCWLASLGILVAGAFLTKRNKQTTEKELRITKWRKSLDAKTRVRLVSLFVVVTVAVLATAIILVNEL